MCEPLHVHQELLSIFSHRHVAVPAGIHSFGCPRLRVCWVSDSILASGACIPVDEVTGSWTFEDPPPPRVLLSTSCSCCFSLVVTRFSCTGTGTSEQESSCFLTF